MSKALQGVLRWPSSLAEVARRVHGGEPFDPLLREFLDFFYTQPARRIAALAESPMTIAPVEDAYVAATAEHLARSYRLPVPEWSEERGMDLKRPFFAGGLDSLKAILTAESPTAFRRRLLFVSADALSRPRMLAERATADAQPVRPPPRASSRSKR